MTVVASAASRARYWLAGQSGDVEIGRQEGLERHRARDLAHADQARGKLEDLRVDLFEEMFRLQEVGDAVEGFVVDQQRAKQRLLRFDVVRCGAKRRSVLWRGLARGLIDSHERDAD